MTQFAESRIWSIIDRVFPATTQPQIAFDHPGVVLDEAEDEDDKLRLHRDENFYWGWCMYGHW